MTDPAATAATPRSPGTRLTVDDALEAPGRQRSSGPRPAPRSRRRRAKYGPNRFADAPKEPRWQAFLRQYKDPMQIVLLAAGILSLFLPDQVATGVVLIGLTLLNAAMGLNQEGKAERERGRAPEDDGRPGQGPARRQRSPRSRWRSSSRATS